MARAGTLPLSSSDIAEEPAATGASRDVGIDALRVIAICAVVVMHLSATQLFFRASVAAEIVNGLTVWAVPLFFVVSGYLFGASLPGSDSRSWLKRRTRRILVPYFFWTAVYLLAARALHYPFPGWFSVLFLGGAFSSLWFLPALLYVTVLAVLVCSRLSTAHLVPVLVVTYMGAVILLDAFLPQGIPGPLGQLLVFGVSLLPLLAAYLLGSDLARPSRPVVPRPSGLLLIAVLLAVSAAQSALLGWPRPSTFWVSAVWSLLGCFIAYLLLLQVLQRPREGIVRVLARCAPLVFGVYLTHGLLLMVLARVLPLTALPPIPWMVASFAVVCACSACAVAVLLRVPVASQIVR